MTFELLPGEQQLHRSNANMVVVVSDYGLSDFAAGQLLSLVGMRGKESIGGRVYITSLRVAFAAHPVNRLRGVFSVPIPRITGAEPWQSGISFGFQVATKTATIPFVSWSRRPALTAIEQARKAFGEAERALVESALSSGTDLKVRQSAEALNQIAGLLFKWVGGN